MSQLPELKDFLSRLNIGPAEKNFVFDFCKKNEYIDALMNAAIDDVKGHVSIGYGNINGKIMLIFRDENSLKILKSVIQEFFERFGIDLWTVYITYVNKTEQEYGKKYNLLFNEINAIKPEIIYFVEQDDNNVIELKKEFNKYGVKFPKHYVLDPEKLVGNEQDKREIIKVLKFAVNYKDIYKK